MKENLLHTSVYTTSSSLFTYKPHPHSTHQLYQPITVQYIHTLTGYVDIVIHH